MLISAKIIKNPKTTRVCDFCNTILKPNKPRMRLYGSASSEDSKFVIYEHLECAKNINNEKVKKELNEFYNNNGN